MFVVTENIMKRPVFLNEFTFTHVFNTVISCKDQNYRPINKLSLHSTVSHLNPVTVLTSRLFETHLPPVPPMGSAPKLLQSKCFYTSPPAQPRPYENYWSTLCQQWYPFIHLLVVVCLTTGPKPLPKRALHTVRSIASSFKWEYPLLSLRSCSSFLCLFPRLPVTSMPPFIFPSITRCRRQFLCKMWPIQLAFHLLFHARYSSAPWL